MKKFKPQVIHLKAQGLSKILGKREAKIMRFIWRKGKVSVRQVCDEMDRKKQGVFNTNMTVMNHLVEKGLLSKKQKGDLYFYEPTQDEQTFLKSISSGILRQIISDPHLFNVAAFLDTIESIAPDTLKKLEEYFKKYENKK